MGPVLSSRPGVKGQGGKSLVAPSLLRGVWTSCKAAPCQELSGDGRKKERKRGEGEARRRARERERERWSVVVPEGEALDDASVGPLAPERGEEREAGEESEGDGASWREGEAEADMQATEKRGNTPTSVT